MFRPRAARVCSLVKQTANPTTATASMLVLTCVEGLILHATHAYNLAKQAASPSTATANKRVLMHVQPPMFLSLRAALACSPARLAVNPTAATANKRKQLHLLSYKRASQTANLGAATVNRPAPFHAESKHKQYNKYNRYKRACLQTCQAGCKTYGTCNCQQSCAHVCGGNVAPQPLPFMPMQPAPSFTMPPMPQFSTPFWPQFALSPCLCNAAVNLSTDLPELLYEQLSTNSVVNALPAAMPRRLRTSM
ncbi:hypothetical protein OSTOST_01197 [Ostertagia ostertagi]